MGRKNEKMAKNNNTVLWIIGIVILLIIILSQSNINLYNLFKKQEGIISLTPHYYKDGVEVFSSKGFLGLFTMVTPPGGSFDQISFSVPGTAIGDISLSNIQIIDAYPIAFKNALPLTIQSLLVGQTKTLWTSDLMETVQFEGQTINFWVEVSAVNDYTGETIYAPRAYSGEISFEAEYTCPVGTDNGDGTCTVILQDADTENLDDAFTSQNDPDRNTGHLTYMMALAWSNRYMDNYLRFDSSSISPPIYVISADLCLYAYQNKLDDDTEGFNMASRHLYQSFSWSEETLTWNTDPTSSYGEIEDTVVLRGPDNPLNEWICWDISSMTQYMFDNHQENISIFLETRNAFGSPFTQDWVYFYSKEYTGDTSLRPKLTITYQASLPHNWVYQEDADVISCVGDFVGTKPCSNGYDRNWGTYTNCNSGICYLYVNYTKPVGALSSSLWRIKYKQPIPPEADGKNLTLSGCELGDVLKFRISIDTPPSPVGTDWSCWNGNNWVVLEHDYSYNVIYEEAMWWDVE